MVKEGGEFLISMYKNMFRFWLLFLLIFVICLSFLSTKKTLGKNNNRDEIETQWEEEKRETEKCEKDFRPGSDF